MPTPRINLKMPSGRHLGLGILVVFLVGCTGLDTPDATPVAWTAHRDSLQLLKHWTAKGKLALRSDTASESAGLLWQQQDQNTHLQLSGPLGVGATIIHSDGQQLDIRRGDEHKIIDISTPEAVVLNTGWDLPLLALPYWLKGIPSPEHEIQKLQIDSQSGLLQRLQQDDWHIHYQQYEQFQTYILPTRLHIQRGSTHVTVLIRRWQDLPS
jgi:outer membrane lipoprotein LolB